MLRRALALSFVFVLAVGTAAIAGQALPIQILNTSELEFEGLAESMALLDDAGDIYHPAGSPGFTDPGIDLRRVEVTGWALRGETPDNPFLDESLALADILSGGSTERSFEGGAPYVNVTTFFEGMLPLSGDIFCEFPFAWNNPNYEPFQGIEGDLFNGTNHVLVLRAGGAVEGGFEVENLVFFDGAWGRLDPIGWGALYMDGGQATYTVPYGLFGPAGDAFRMRSIDLLQGSGGTDAEPVDMNFGSFCSEGGQSFDPSLGGVDILQAPVDLGAIPIGIVEQQGAAQPTTTTTVAPTTTAAPEPTTPPTSVAAGEEADSGGGLSPVVIAAILGGLAAAAAAVRAASKKARQDDDRPSGRSFRLAFDSGHAGSFADVSGLSLEPGPIEYRDGLESSHTRSMPGMDKQTNITLKRGTAGDLAFWNWVLDSMNDQAHTGGGSISLLSESEPPVKWTFSDSWPTKIEGPGLKSTGAETALESMEITVENLRISGTP